MKKGFTLIELLAVIVILAIIALIAVPIVINIINDSKEESQQRSVDLYMDHVQNAITKHQMTHPGFKPTICDIVEKGNLKCGEDIVEVEIKGQVPESGTIRFNINNKINYRLVLDNMEYIMNSSGKQDPHSAPTQATGEDYRGYYADIDGDGEVDGIIYADLNKSESGQWGNSDVTYSYEAQTGLKEYEVSSVTYKANDGFGEKEIIRVKPGSTGKERFYLIALNDFTTEDYTSFYWYKNAFDPSNFTGIMTTFATDTRPNFGKGYENTGNMIEIWNKNGTGNGSYTGATQDNMDIWKHIQKKYQEKWYIPSLEEWQSFADYFTNNERVETKLTTSNYNNTFGLSSYYWSSSHSSQRYSWGIVFSGDGYMGYADVNNIYFVRLGATF